MSNLAPKAWYCDSAQWTAVTAWPSNTAKSAGAIIRQNATPTVGNERVFVAIVGGTTTNGSEPSWTVTRGAKTTDNTVTWQECTGHPAVNGDLTNTTAWIHSTSTTLGDIITDVAGTHIFINSTAGTTGSSEPSWNTSAVGNTTTDSGATWTYLGTSFSAWAAPGARLGIVMASNWGVAGNTFFVGDDHAETQSSGYNFPNQQLGTAALPCYAYCVDHTKSVPPNVSADLKTTATITETGAFQNMSVMSSGGWCYFYGIGFSVTGGGSLFVENASGATGRATLDTCTLTCTNSATLTIGYSNNGASNFVDFNNTTITLSAAGQIQLSSRFRWRNTASAIGGTVPTGGLINLNSASPAAVFEGVDLSALGSNPIFSASETVFDGLFSFINCKFGSGWVVNGSGGLPQNALGTSWEIISCDSAGTIYRQQRYQTAGSLTDSETVIRTGGASDGTTAISWQITTGASANWIWAFESFPISMWNTRTGVNVTVTLYGIWNSASLPNNDDVWIDVAYFGASGSPLASIVNSSKANFLASNAANSADSSSAWDTQVTARQNSHAYTTSSAPIKVSDNPGRVFFCTANGTSAGSEPAGYATAVDGGSVTDGTATFRAGVRFSMAVTLSSPQPQLAGYLRTTVKAAKASSTFYVDPLPVFS